MTDPSQRRHGPGLLGGLVSGVAGAVTPSVVDSVDVNAVINDVDINQVLARVDLDEQIERVDVNALLDRVDPNQLLDRVDPDRLLDRVDPNRLLERVDVDRLMERVDVDALVARTSIAEIITSGTTGVAQQWLNYVRRLVAGVDTVVTGFAARVTRQPRRPDPPGPPALVETASEPGALTGAFAGPVTRLAAYALDSMIAFSIYTLGAIGVNYALGLVGAPEDAEQTALPAILLALWLVFYYWVSWALTGRTVGMAIGGVRVVTKQGLVLGARGAFVRAVALPLSFLFFGLGFVGLVVGQQRRGLHDAIAGTVVVYDWGDHPAELPAPLAAFLRNRDVDVARAPAQSVRG